jgi:hypothetical protein
MVKVLVLGVNPFEDLPGYQLFSMLRKTGSYVVVGADDSDVARRILSRTNAALEWMPQPSGDERAFALHVARLCEQYDIDILLPGTDAALHALAHAISDVPQIAPRCPSLSWLAEQDLTNKVSLQLWAERFCRVPRRWDAGEEDSVDGQLSDGFAVMVKGLRKGAVKCDDRVERIAAERELLRNPANAGHGGGIYYEQCIEGEEHSLLLVVDARRALHTFGFRKLAVTKLGTTLAGEVNDELPSDFDVGALVSSLPCQAVVELEWRKDTHGRQWLFEINARFPSWIGALGDFGSSMLEDYISTVRGETRSIFMRCNPPRNGQLFYRLPQSGFLPMQEVFADVGQLRKTPMSRASYQPALLWRATSPHQFRLK